MNEKTSKDLKDIHTRLKMIAKELKEEYFFDSVIIGASFTNSDDETCMVNAGVGNRHTRYGLMTEILAAEEDYILGSDKMTED